MTGWLVLEESQHSFIEMFQRRDKPPSLVSLQQKGNTMIKKILVSTVISLSLLEAGNTDVKSFIEDLKAVSSALKTEATPIDSSAELLNKIQTINNQTQVVQATKRFNESNPEFSNANYKKQLSINKNSLAGLSASISYVTFIPINGFYEVNGDKFCIVNQYLLNSQINTMMQNVGKKQNIDLLVFRLNKLVGYKDIDLTYYRSELDSINMKITTLLEQSLMPINMTTNAQSSQMQDGNNITLKSNMLLTDKIKVLEISDTWVKIGLI